jgi:predicted lipoprotein with Yx(FWY)xxD motif
MRADHRCMRPLERTFRVTGLLPSCQPVSGPVSEEDFVVTWTKLLVLPATAAAVGVLAACGSTPAAPPAPPSAAAAPGAAADPHAGMDMGNMQGGSMQGMDMGGGGGVELWAVQTGPLGVVVTDGSGSLLYRSDRDANSPSASNCTDACAATWQPVVVDAAQPPSLLGVDKSAVGAITRSDGSQQVTLAGWPLYRHKGDKVGLADAEANGTDGVWFAVKPDGGKASPA